jgi:hypothetical protein
VALNDYQLVAREERKEDTIFVDIMETDYVESFDSKTTGRLIQNYYFSPTIPNLYFHSNLQYNQSYHIQSPILSSKFHSCPRSVVSFCDHQPSLCRSFHESAILAGPGDVT